MKKGTARQGGDRPVVSAKASFCSVCGEGPVTVYVFRKRWRCLDCLDDMVYEYGYHKGLSRGMLKLLSNYKGSRFAKGKDGKITSILEKKNYILGKNEGFIS